MTVYLGVTQSLTWRNGERLPETASRSQPRNRHYYCPRKYAIMLHDADRLLVHRLIASYNLTLVREYLNG